MTPDSTLDRSRTRANDILVRVLVPLARCLLRVGVDYQAFNECAKVAFVRGASEEERLAGRVPSVGAVSLLTGLTRVQTSGLLKGGQGDHAAAAIGSSAVELAADIVHFWQHDPDFMCSQKKPKPLPFSAPFPSFCDLVKRYAKGVPAEAIAQELVGLDAVHRRSDGWMIFKKGFFVPADHRDRLLLSLDRSVRCLLETLAYNTNPTRAGDGRIERLVYSRSLTEEQVEALRPVIRETIEKFSADMDRRIGDDETTRAGFFNDPILDTHIAVGVFYAQDSPPNRRSKDVVADLANSSGASAG